MPDQTIPNQVVSIAAGNVPPPVTQRVLSGQKRIGGIEIDNTNSSIPAWLYLDSNSTSGAAILVPAGARRGYAVDCQVFTVGWLVKAISNGTVLIQWSDQPIVSSGDSTLISSYPSGATPFACNESGALQWTSPPPNPFTQFTGGALPQGNAGQRLYLTQIFIRGLEVVKYQYNIVFADPNGINVDTLYTNLSGYDMNLACSIPLPTAFFKGSGQGILGLQSANNANIVNTINFDGLIAGYVL